MKQIIGTILLLLPLICNSQVIENEWRDIHFTPIVIIATIFTVNEIIIHTVPYEDVKKYTWKVAVTGMVTAGIVVGVKHCRDKKKKSHQIKYGGLYKKTNKLKS